MSSNIINLYFKGSENMAEKKIDKRALKTRRAITNALAELLAEKELRKITVQEISDTADVNRVTFYKHYLDIYDLYDKMENDILSELGILILGYQENNAENFASGMADYIYDNPKIFKMIFSAHNTAVMRNKFEKMIEGLFRVIQSEKAGTDYSDCRLSYYCSYQANGCIAILEKWVCEDFSQPKNFIIKAITDLNSHTDDYILTQIKQESVRT